MILVPCMHTKNLSGLLNITHRQWHAAYYSSVRQYVNCVLTYYDTTTVCNLHYCLGGVEAADLPQTIAFNSQSSLEKTNVGPDSDPFFFWAGPSRTEVVLEIVCIYGQPHLSPLKRSQPLPDRTDMPKPMLGDLLLSQLQAASAPPVNPCKNWQVSFQSMFWTIGLGALTIWNAKPQWYFITHPGIPHQGDGKKQRKL